MRHSLLEKTAAFIAQERLFKPSETLLVGLSGGLDSVVLLHVLRALGYSVRVAHFNYGLRGEESDGDANFVKNLTHTLGISFDYRSSKGDERRALQTENLQATARKLRYDWFTELQNQHNIHSVCTAHHLEDNLETLFLQLSRGTSFTGLCGMQPRLENGLCRPFLDTPRSLIEDFARANQLIWREDRTNAQKDYLRNQIRHDLLPTFLGLQPDAHQRLSNTFDRLRTEQQLFLAGLDQLWQIALVAPNTIDRTGLPAERDMALRLLHHQLRSFGFKGDQFRQMLEAGSGTVIEGRLARVWVKKNLLVVDRI